jgi:hypothetical protein
MAGWKSWGIYPDWLKVGKISFREIPYFREYDTF